MSCLYELGHAGYTNSKNLNANQPATQELSIKKGAKGTLFTIFKNITLLRHH
jgi:hypothetical protein